MLQANKEPNFFNKDENYNKGFTYYRSLFPIGNGKGSRFY